VFGNTFFKAAANSAVSCANSWFLQTEKPTMPVGLPKQQTLLNVRRLKHFSRLTERVVQTSLPSSCRRPVKQTIAPITWRETTDHCQ